MSISTINPDLTSLADLTAVLEHLEDSTPIDPEVTRRVRQRSERMTEELRRNRGEIEVAVD